MGLGFGAVSLGWLLSLAAGVLLVLAWVGWRFFLRAIPVATQAQTSLPTLLSVVRPMLPRLCVWRERIAENLRAGGMGRALLAGALVLLLTMGLAYAMRGLVRPDPLTGTPGLFGAHIGQMFAPDELVPPPALPPEFFVSSDDPNLESADRDWHKLEAGFRQQVVWLIERARQRGIGLTLLEGYRSPERQTRLASAGPGVTRAGAFQSKHQYGLAADLAPVRDGRLAMNEADPWVAEAYRVLGEEAVRAGLVWGGHWSLRDLGHVEIAGALVARRNEQLK